MILAQAPLRFSLGGGGSDLPGYAEAHGGFVVSAAIDARAYVLLHRRFDGVEDLPPGVEGMVGLTFLRLFDEWGAKRQQDGSWRFELSTSQP